MPPALATISLLLRRCAARHWRLAPGSSALLVLILALGVAVFVAVRLANRAAVASFQHFTDTLTGQSDWLIRPPAGDLPESVLGELRTALGGSPVHIVPVLEATAAEPAAPGTPAWERRTFTLLGIDLVGAANLAPLTGAPEGFFGGASDDGGGRDIWSELRGAPGVWVSPASGLRRGDTLPLILDDATHSLRVAGTIPVAREAPPPPAHLLVLDLPQLQRLTHREGRLDRVEFVLEPGPRRDERRVALRDTLEQLGAGGRWTVSTPGARREVADTMTQAFRLNLTVLSLIALLVGLYLVLQALDGAVVRRRAEIATLRSLGVEPREIHGAWLLEAAALGLAGGVLGLLLGWAGAQVAVRAVGQTVNALYFATTVGAAALDPREALVALGVSVAAAVLAGLWPAREASLTPPAQVLARHAAPAAGSRVWRQWPLALACLGIGYALVQAPPWRLGGGTRFPLGGYLAALLWIGGTGILSGLLLPAAGQLLRGWSQRRAEARIARGHLLRPGGRHRLAVAALVCATAMTAGMAILVASFENTVRAWVAQALQADLYVSSNAARSVGNLGRVGPETWLAVVAHPAVAEASVLTAYPIELDGRPTLLSGTLLAQVAKHDVLPWIAAPRDDAVFDPARNTGLCLVSEAFTERFGKTRGDTVRVPTTSGPRELHIAGVFADYGNERGSILVERAPLMAWMGDDHVTSISLYLRDGAQPEAVRAELERAWPALLVYTNATLRAEIWRIFRQTFAITYALEVIGIVVAMAGLGLALASVLLDRRDELTTLRALGLTRHELALTAAIEGGAVAMAATVGGLALSGGLGWVLIHVINKQSFGWTLAVAVPWGQLAALAAVVVTTGVVVSYGVGRWGAALPADREEA